MWLITHSVADYTFSEGKIGMGVWQIFYEYCTSTVASCAKNYTMQAAARADIRGRGWSCITSATPSLSAGEDVSSNSIA